jgi:hypothetical protein
MTDRPYTVPPPRDAGPTRRVLHTLISAAGWILFVYWWWIVFQRVSRDEMRFTALFVALSLVVIVLVTLGWVWHNLGIFNRRGPRKAAVTAKAEFRTDGVGRPVSFPSGGIDRHSAPVVYVRVEGNHKRYDFAKSTGPNVRVVDRHEKEAS